MAAGAAGLPAGAGTGLATGIPAGLGGEAAGAAAGAAGEWTFGAMTRTMVIAGTSVMAPHLAHLACLPAESADANSRVPQC